MKKLLFLTGLVMAAVLSACSGGNSKGTTRVKIDDVGWVVVDTFTANHYTQYRIKNALTREEYVSKVTKPTDASTFGKKIAEREWRAFNVNLEEKGTVTTVEYERGFEVIKDGKHWFYDIEHMNQSNIEIRMDIGAAESVLHPGVWEPVEIRRSMSNDVFFTFVYDCGAKERESFLIWEPEEPKYRIYGTSDVRIKETRFK
ncbi:MAG: hypothetical protein J6T18_05315 [Bacteroidaceae bacterium]|nr:hypothetical protein [Bacteroidaceae bacterium]